MTRTTVTVAWSAQALAAAILLMTVPAKLLAGEEAVQTFTVLGVEPWGRIALGVVELAVAVLLLVPATAAVGAALALGLMVGALGAHFGPLGIAPGGDPSLFLMAGVAFVAAATATWLRRHQLPLATGVVGAAA